MNRAALRLMLICIAGLPVTATLVGWGGIDQVTAAAQGSNASPEQPQFVCPMHAEIRESKPGTCPRCGMALVRKTNVVNGPYVLDARIQPRSSTAGQRSHLKLLIRHPTSGEIVRDFVEVHEKTLHLFIVSRDLQHFEHAHPEHLPDGSFEIDATLPRPGSYQLYLDFMPLSGTPQLLQRSVVTTGFVDDPYATRAILQTDVAPRQDQGLRVTLQLPAGGGLIAGRQEMFRLHVDDMASGEPVTDLEPYLGATGHVLIVSDDLADAVHSHPVEEFSKRTGPDVVFEAVFPRSGLYKMWAQFQRRGKVAVVPFVIPVADPS